MRGCSCYLLIYIVLVWVEMSTFSRIQHYSQERSDISMADTCKSGQLTVPLRNAPSSSQNIIFSSSSSLTLPLLLSSAPSPAFRSPCPCCLIYGKRSSSVPVVISHLESVTNTVYFWKLGHKVVDYSRCTILPIYFSRRWHLQIIMSGVAVRPCSSWKPTWNYNNINTCNLPYCGISPQDSDLWGCG